MTSIGFIDNKAVNLLSAPLTLTGSFQDLGPILVSGDYELSAIWLDLDINSSTGIVIQCLVSPTEDFAVAYNIPIQDVLAAAVGVAAQVFTLTNNVDQKIVIPVEIGDAVPFIKFQIKATVVGGTPGQLLSAKVSAQTTGRG